MSWYRTGTVAVTNGSKTVTGVGTLWTTAVNAGDAFALVDANLNPTGAWYEVESVTNNTTLVLKQSYAGSTGSNKQYCVFNLVGNMTTPSFAQRLATFFASFQSFIDKPTTTPTASSIPIADANGDIDSGWLKDASTTVKGVVKVGSNISVADGVISIPDTSATVKGVVKVGSNISVADGVISIPDTSATVKGVVKVGSNISVADGVISIPDTSATVKGVVKVGSNISVADGVISIPDTSTTVKGVVEVGANLSVDSGVISVPEATETVKGVVELATPAEVLAGVDTERAVTPAGFLAGLRGNIRGTVSQVGGVPTGAIIERGSNANGEYTKFADGTMIAYASLTMTKTNNDGVGTNGTLPAAFISAPVICSTSGVTSGGGAACRVSEGSATATTYTVKRLTVQNGGYVTGDGTGIAWFLFVGRWY